MDTTRLAKFLCEFTFLVRISHDANARLGRTLPSTMSTVLTRLIFPLDKITHQLLSMPLSTSGSSFLVLLSEAQNVYNRLWFLYFFLGSV